MTLNENWGYHAGDHHWKSPADVAEMLRQCAAGCGNLVLNVGPMGDGTIPPPSVACLDAVGAWLAGNHEAIFDTERFVSGMHDRSEGRADWTSSGRFTGTRDAFYWHIRHWPGSPLTLAGVESEVTEVTHLATGRSYPFEQRDTRVIVHDVPTEMDTTMPQVVRFRTSGPPSIYLCGGQRVPQMPHCRYDPLPSDMLVRP